MSALEVGVLVRIRPSCPDVLARGAVGRVAGAFEAASALKLYVDFGIRGAVLVDSVHCMLHAPSVDWVPGPRGRGGPSRPPRCS